MLVKGARDGALTADLLRDAGVTASICSSARELCARMEEGAAAALLAEEVLGEGVLEALAEAMSRQPAWSDFPIVVFSSGRASDGSVAREEDVRVLGNVTFLDRPVRTRSMLAAVRSAIRSRRRQYEARRAIDSRDRFLAMLGHELRNPLASIRLAADMLKRKAPEPVRELAIVDRQAAHLTRLVNDLLDVARVTHGKLVLRMGELDLVEVVRHAFDAQEPRARERGLAYELKAPSEVLGVHGDRQRLEQVLANLLTNAIKYTPDGGAVMVTVRAEDGWAVAEVADTGIGIPAEMLGRVFDAFAQADRALDRSEGGIGLGLAVVRNLVQLHGGAVHASSEGPGRGSSFVVRLPEIQVRPGAENPSSPRLEPRPPSKRVVVVEDSADIRQLLVDMLAGDGHEVWYAEDGPHGLQEILRLAPEIAFVDVGLPGFDGFELARRVRAAGSCARLVAVTAYGQPQDRRNAFEAGFDDHLTKPVDGSDLQRAVLGR